MRGRMAYRGLGPSAESRDFQKKHCMRTPTFMPYEPFLLGVWRGGAKYSGSEVEFPPSDKVSPACILSPTVLQQNRATVISYWVC